MSSSSSEDSDSDSESSSSSNDKTPTSQISHLKGQSQQFRKISDFSRQHCQANMDDSSILKSPSPSAMVHGEYLHQLAQKAAQQRQMMQKDTY